MKSYLMSIFLIVAFFSFTEVNALKPQKIDICHLDAETNTYKLLNVSQSGWENDHKQHGDGLPGEGTLDENCQVIQPVKRFARVYREKGSNESYDPTTDDLYVEVVDFNDGNPDGVLNAGDKVIVIALPADFTGDTVPVNDSEHIITSINAYTAPTSLSLVTDDGGFSFSSNGNEFYIEALDIENPPPPNEDGSIPTFSILQDNIGGGAAANFADRILITNTSPSQPVSNIVQAESTSAENPWLEVRIYP